MRMMFRLRREQDGAVVAMVAISLVVLIGALVLTVDLGRMVAVRRQMVAGSDSAALAAAQECAMGHTVDLAQAAADSLAGQNVAGSTRTTFSAPGCGIRPATPGVKLVTVGYQKGVDMFFAPIFGVSSGTVTGRAVAQWGPVTGVTSPVPIRIASAALTPCISHDVGYNGSDCAFAYDNDPNQAQWGILNFPEGWPTSGVGPPSCNGAGGQSDVNSYIYGTGTTFQADIPNPPGYAYVCAQSGARSDTMSALNSMIQQSAPNPFYLTFPVMSSSIPLVDLGGNRLAVPIVGFTVLRVIGAWFGQEARAHCTFAASVQNSSLFCIQTQWDGDQVVPGVPGGGYDYGAMGIRLAG